MKAWKEEIAREIVNEWESENVINMPAIGETDRAVKFSDAAKKLGYNHVDRADIGDIVKQVEKIAPNLKAIRMVADPDHAKATESAWSTLYFTDLAF